jgi:hypothetical protein
MTDKPELIGVGGSNPDNFFPNHPGQTRQKISTMADGVSIGAPVVHQIVSGASPGEVATMITGCCAALDGVAR